ncbi:tyrosine protein phosphatase [Paenibacillus rhizovicinus]|uniref:Tyrosine-protein phosphatase n=1 Tax=Paenibacillus rhizovicinus TaxID=2704463 RepID=A0A6C0P708_9BACL|nr:CpsB/CapC family capsule biosynthesis tyrosine phosphatase [Paenibacillus rhizovicinus]QHW34308.1 tyrosine protein phosphatase [Paenibacillus rhizovicinus]
MIDMHCHLLPGLDDGPDHLEEAVNLARCAASEGVTAIIATPHYRRGVYETDAGQVRQAAEHLSDELRRRRIPLLVQAGQEIRVYDEMVADLEAGRLLPLGNSSYVLLELPSARIPLRIEDTLHELRIAGWTPIIAHPERNAQIAADPDQLVRLAGFGAAAQLTSHSLTGRFGKAIKAAALELCRRNLVHTIASDAHNGTTRPYELRAAHDIVTAKLGRDFAASYERNARAVWQDTPLEHGKLTERRSAVTRLLAKWSPF